MFKIGDFSRLTQVSVRMLRYYDELDLLKPVRVDQSSGYRYYSADQLGRLNRILALRDLGLSLEQIATLLNQDLTPEQLRGMLKLKRSELQRELVEGQAQLDRIEKWLQQEEVLMPAYDVVTKKLEPITVAEARGLAPDYERLGPTLDKLFDAVMTFISQQNAKSTTPGITLYYDEGFRDKDWHVGACMGISGKVQDNEQIKVITLPGYDLVASVVHHGPFSSMGDAYKALLEWIGNNNYTIIGPGREINVAYERGGEQSQFVTEIQYPIAKIS